MQTTKEKAVGWWESELTLNDVSRLINKYHVSVPISLIDVEMIYTSEYMEQLALSSVPLVENESVSTVAEAAIEYVINYKYTNNHHGFLAGSAWQQQQSANREKELLGVIGELGGQLQNTHSFILQYSSSPSIKHTETQLLEMGTEMKNMSTSIEKAKQYLK